MTYKTMWGWVTTGHINKDFVIVIVIIYILYGEKMFGLFRV